MADRPRVGPESDKSTLLAEIDITGDGPGHINTTTKLPFGKFVVLAQVAAPGDGGAPRLYIVRAEPVAG